MIIDCAFEVDWWASHDVVEQLASTAISAAIQHIDQKLDDESEVSLLFTDDQHMQALNHQWRQIQKPTNVLSFAAHESGGPPTPVLGDIVLARGTIEREAAEQSKNLDDHLSHLIIHGFLHLLGYDHETAQEAQIMENLETQILADLTIADPYAT